MSRLSAPGDKDLAAQWGMNVVCYTQPMATALARRLLWGHVRFHLAGVRVLMTGLLAMRERRLQRGR